MGNKVVLVTGSAKGLGRKIILEFAEKGYDVVINYCTSKDKAEELESVVKKLYNVKAISVCADITKEVQVEMMINRIIDEFGRIDVLVNNSAIFEDIDFERRTPQSFKDTYEVNVVGAYNVSKAVSKYMLENKYGKIVNISSNNSINCYDPVTMDYDCSKAALNILTKDLAIQFAPYINVNAVAPGWVMTEAMENILTEDFLKYEKERILKARFAKPEEVAKLVYFLASDDADYINGETIKIDGGTR